MSGNLCSSGSQPLDADPVIRCLRVRNINEYMSLVIKASGHKYVDLKFLCSDGYLWAHRLVVANISPFLAACFDDQMPGETTVVSVEDVSVRVLALMLDLAYSGACKVPKEMMGTFHEGMQILGWVKLEVLQNEVENYPSRSSTPSSSSNASRCSSDEIFTSLPKPYGPNHVFARIQPSSLNTISQDPSDLSKYIKTLKSGSNSTTTHSNSTPVIDAQSKQCAKPCSTAGNKVIEIIDLEEDSLGPQKPSHPSGPKSGSAQAEKKSEKNGTKSRVHENELMIVDLTESDVRAVKHSFKQSPVSGDSTTPRTRDLPKTDGKDSETESKIETSALTQPPRNSLRNKRCLDEDADLPSVEISSGKKSRRDREPRSIVRLSRAIDPPDELITLEEGEIVTENDSAEETSLPAKRDSNSRPSGAIGTTPAEGSDTRKK